MRLHPWPIEYCLESQRADGNTVIELRLGILTLQEYFMFSGPNSPIRISRISSTNARTAFT